MTNQTKHSNPMEDVLLYAGKSVSVAVMIFGFMFLLGPIIIVVISSFTNASYLIFPPQEFSMRWYKEVFTLSWFSSSIMTSFIIPLFYGELNVY